jgi:integrase
MSSVTAKPRKREIIEGIEVCIYPEGSGYTGVLYYGKKPNGSWDRPKRKGANKTIVRDKLRQVAQDRARKVTASRAHTVTSVVTEYVDEMERGEKAPSTIRTYRSAIKNHVSKIGAIKVKDLEPAHVSAWLVDLSATLSPEVLRKVHALLTRALNRAIVYRYVSENVSLPVARPTGTTDNLRESKSFSVAQVANILATCVSPFLPFGAYVALAITSGLRTDEMLGLTWRWLELDADEPAVYVERAARHNGRLKTENSRRGLTARGCGRDCSAEPQGPSG